MITELTVDGRAEPPHGLDNPTPGLGWRSDADRRTAHRIRVTGNSNYQLSAEYRAYDVTEVLRPGANSVGVRLGNGPACVRRVAAAEPRDRTGRPHRRAGADRGDVPPVTATRPAPGGWVFDLGQNLAGMPLLRLRDGVPAGVTVRLTPAEPLAADGTVGQASLLGVGDRAAEAARHRSLADDIRSAFYDTGLRRYLPSTQAAQALADGGRDDEPGYGHFMAPTVANPGGMTTIGERWNPADSRNHVILAQIDGVPQPGRPTQGRRRPHPRAGQLCDAAGVAESEWTRARDVHVLVRRTAIAALWPGIPLTPPPRCAPAPQISTRSCAVSTPHVPSSPSFA